MATRWRWEIKETSFGTGGGSLFQASGVTGVKETVALGSAWSSCGRVTIDKSLGYTRYLNPTGVFSNIAQSSAPQEPADPIDPQPPNDPSVQANMQLWLKNPGHTFIPGSGAFDAVWQDSSGRGHHLASFAGVAGGGASGTVNDFARANDDPTRTQLPVPSSEAAVTPLTPSPSPAEAMN
jgi:hypothetical protein